MAVDDSFKKPGAVPFNWEIKPGVPRAQHHLHHQQKGTPPSLPPPTPSPPPLVQSINHHQLTELPSPKLRPPPAVSYALSSVEPQTRSLRSTPRIRSGRWRFDRSIFARSESVSSSCFFSSMLSLLRRMPSRRNMIQKAVIEPDYTSDLETLARCSLSSRKSLSPLHDSTTASSSPSSYRSPPPESDAEWTGFGLS